MLGGLRGVGRGRVLSRGSLGVTRLEVLFRGAGSFEAIGRLVTKLKVCLIGRVTALSPARGGCSGKVCRVLKVWED